MEEEIYFGKTEEQDAVEIHREEYKGFTFKILSMGSHPCAYVLIPKDHILFNIEYDDIVLEAHGGLTYAGLDKNDEYWIGWDYAHYGDFTFFDVPGMTDRSGKKWTKEEIINECKFVIDKLFKLKRFQYKKFYYSEEDMNW